MKTETVEPKLESHEDEDPSMAALVRQYLQKYVVDGMRINNEIVRQFLAEFLGTAFLLLIGTAANIQGHASINGQSTSVYLAWGFGFMFSVMMSAGISGAHLNPAMSFMFWIQGDISVLRMFIYWVAQYAGAIIGSLLSFIGHYDDIMYLGSSHLHVTGENATAGLFAPYPTPHVSNFGAFVDQIFGTAILAAMIVLITDKRHGIPSHQQPILAGATMSMIAMTFGDNGFGINPARDLGPRIMALIVGYGPRVFSASSWYFWVPLLAQHVGAPLGAWIYKIFIGLHGTETFVEDISGGNGGSDKRTFKLQDDPDFDFPPNPSSGLENLTAFRRLDTMR
uniref:Aquaporin-3 n=1 Tax=Panagrellus redivivus TaxID=6233 RepID=A0A7E4ZWL0_PANRE